MSDFLAGMKQRKLVQWALAYVAAAFALIQVLDVVAQRFGWPEQAERVAILALGVGFFVVLVLAWYHGERGVQRVTGTELLILALLLLIGGVALWRLAPGPQSADATASHAGSRAVVAKDMDIPPKSVAVLPFENFSADKANAYFASGMQDEILSRLAGIADLKVISRTSTQKYASRPDNLRTVAGELGVATVVEGSVQRAGDSVRVIVQLIDARNDNHLWAQTYDRELKNVFAVESEVAQQIAEALKARLSPQETRALDRPPTRDAGAYDAFLKGEFLGNKAYASALDEDYEAADAAFGRALDLDPSFALALARKAYYRMRRHWDVQQLTEAQLADVKVAADKALALAPELPEAHLALADWYYRGYRRYDDAIAELQQALRLAPNFAVAQATLGYIYGRKGDLEQSTEVIQRAAQLSPRDSHISANLGVGYWHLRRFADAERQMAHTLEIDPEDSLTRSSLPLLLLYGRGDSAGARAAVVSAPGWSAVATIAGNGEFGGGDISVLLDWHVYPDLFERHFDAALRAWDSAPVRSDDDRLVQALAHATIRFIAGEHEAARGECARVAAEIDAAGAKYPDSPAYLLLASWYALCSGHKDVAIAAARRAAQIMSIGKDAYVAGDYLAGLAEVDVQAGAADEALKLIEQLLALPGAGNVMTTERLKRDPVFDPLRPDPRFAKIIAQFEVAAAKP